MKINLRRIYCLFLALLICAGCTSKADAEYKSTALVANKSGKAKHVDKFLVNAWGMAHAPDGPFWIGDAGSGKTTLYNGAGLSQGAAISVPPALGGTQGSPTGVVYNGAFEFSIENWPSLFLFATLDGTISGWSTFFPSDALIGADNSSTHASYTGLAITNRSKNNFIFAADTANNKVDIYDDSFNLVKSFSDSTIPAGFVVSGIQDIAGKVFVSYVASSGGAGGYIDIFSESGNFVKRFAEGKPLDQPWGFAVASKNFGPLSDTILISNNTDAGTINGFNRSTGKFIGTIKDKKGKPIKINQLWAIEFGDGSSATGAKNQLFWTAGPRNNLDGLFGVINFKK